MHITRYTDYSLRVLIYLAVKGEDLATISDIASSYDISRNHLMKVVHQLNLNGYIETVRGKHGGMRLRLSPDEINIGSLVRHTEQDLTLVECFAPNNQCAISPACGLRSVFGEALQGFMKVLDGYTLADILPAAQKPHLVRLLNIV